MTSARGFWGLFAATQALLWLALFTQTAGIHWDENGYLLLGAGSRLGDAQGTGKLPVFYLLNYFTNRTLGVVLGPYRWLALYLAYGALSSASLAWFVHAQRLATGRALALWALLVVSPLFVYNGTHVMMEAPVLALLTVLFGLVLRAESGAPSRWARAAEAACVIPAILIKETAVPAVAAIALAALLRDRRLAGWLALWIAVALVLAEAIRAAYHIPAQDFGGLAPWLAGVGFRCRFSIHAKLWLFFVGPLTAVVAVLGGLPILRDLVRRPSPAAMPARRDVLLLGCALASLVFTLAVCFTSRHFARYAYPTIMIGVLALATWAVHSVRSILLPALVVSVAVPTLNAWVPPAHTFRLWPVVVTQEAVHASGTVMFGVPVHAWLLRNAHRAADLCVLTTGLDQPGLASKSRRFVAWALPGARVFDETERAAFDTCQGLKAVIERKQTRDPDCSCPVDQPFWIERCAVQRTTPVVRNRYCLP